jgi:hypothetical protein
MAGTPAEQDWPDQEEFMVEFNKELSKGSDRALVLVAGAMTDELLRRLLQAALPYSSDSLFEGSNAPLGTWSDRSSVVRALGLISADDLRRLNLLRKMRNEMAHQLSLTLSDAAFVSRVREFWIGINVTGEFANDRVKFGSACFYLVTMLSVRIAEVKRHPPIRPLFP